MIDPHLRLRMETVVNEVDKQFRWRLASYAALAFLAALLGLVLGIEYELLYRAFQGIAGEQQQYWSPALMALTGVIMVTAFHLLDRMAENNPALVLIRRLTPYLIGIYLLGLGLLIAGIINLDASGVLLTNPADLVIGGLPDAEPQRPWITMFFDDVSNPAALGLFSLGIGGLGIVNLFVAHALIHGLRTRFDKLRHLKSEADRLNAERETVRQCCDAYRELSYDLGDLDLWSDQRLIREAALQSSTLIQDAARKHRRFIKSRELAPPPGPLSLIDPVDPRLIERDLKNIEALNLNGITRLLQDHAA